MDDILISSPSEKQHKKHLRIALQLLWEHRLYSKYEKCEFRLLEVKFLGLVVSKDGVTVDPAKVEAIMN